jgi:FlaA1/EpsC-like NDP-sugar epimerase
MNQDLRAKRIIERKESFFHRDIYNNTQLLTENISQKAVLVIGGAGTIGSHFIKAIMKFQPAKIVVIDINENELTELVRDLRSNSKLVVGKEFYTYPISFSSPIFSKIFKKHGPFDIVANFAAHKHVRSEKDIYSIEALMENNLFQARDLLEFLTQYKPRHFFCVSTDKAANPVNIMGASKKLMEDMILAYSRHFKITTARFANVAFSNGSLLYGFMMRINKYQPLSCPLNVKRFFVTPEEAGEICMLACTLGNSGEIFFPKMDVKNDLVNFSDILPRFLNEFGYKPLQCSSEDEAKNNMSKISNGLYPVFFFDSDTDGEKLYEEFYTDSEILDNDRFQSLGVIKKMAKYSKEEIADAINSLRELFDKSSVSKTEIINNLKRLIPEFDHIRTGLNLDDKM